MNQEKDLLYKEFEREYLLFLDGELSNDRMSYWNSKLEEYPDLNNFIDEFMSISDEFNTVKNIELRQEKFDNMIDNAIKNLSLIDRINKYFSTLFASDKEFSFGKIAFASVLIIGAIVISIISDRPTPVTKLTNTINSEILQWDADYVDNQISKVGTLLKVTGDDEYRKYYMYNLSTKNVDKNIDHINNNIKNLREELNNKEL